jgi:hypothetical protein
MDRLATIDDVISAVRKYHGLSESYVITPKSLLESDLGITGDDGSDLFTDLEGEFKIKFSDEKTSFRQTFGLEENQFLFHSEVTNPFTAILNLFGYCKENVKPISIGELHKVIVERQKNHVSQQMA